MIWFKKYAISDFKELYSKKTLLNTLEIELTELGGDYLKGTMPVNEKTVQPARILHGGASVALAESIGSIASNLVIDTSKFNCVGLEINANHIRPVFENSGKVTGIAKAVHLGRKTHIWNIEIRSPEGKLSCVSRLTMAIIPVEK